MPGVGVYRCRSGPCSMHSPGASPAEIKSSKYGRKAVGSDSKVEHPRRSTAQWVSNKLPKQWPQPFGNHPPVKAAFLIWAQLLWWQISTAPPAHAGTKGPLHSYAFQPSLPEQRAVLTLYVFS